MKYLDMVLREGMKLVSRPTVQMFIKSSVVLRLYPPLPGNSRAAKHTTTLPTGGGPDGKSPILISRGDVVAYNSYTMQRCKETYGADAEEFRPERWSDGSIKQKDEWDATWRFVPFGGGPRACLGSKFWP